MQFKLTHTSQRPVWDGGVNRRWVASEGEEPVARIEEYTTRDYPGTRLLDRFYEASVRPQLPGYWKASRFASRTEAEAWCVAERQNPPTQQDVVAAFRHIRRYMAADACRALSALGPVQGAALAIGLNVDGEREATLAAIRRAR